MKPLIRDLSKSGAPDKIWSPEDVHETLLYLKDQWEPVHLFLEEQGVPLILEHDIYEDRQRNLLERVKEWGDKIRQEALEAS